MGLDVYLYKCPDRAVADAAENKRAEYSELAWSKHDRYEDFTEEEKSEARKMIEEVDRILGIVDYQHVSRTKVELPSEKYPEHYFKVGYFRSSYNDSGINSVMRRIGLPDLYDLFDTDGQDTNGVHDWKACRARVVDAIKNYSDYLASQVGKFDVMDVGGIGRGPDSNESALEVFLEQFGRWESRAGEDDRGAYSNGNGTYFPDGIKIYGVISGQSKYGNRPTAYIAYEVEGREWYVHALEIVLETIDYILAQPDSEQYYLVWSG